MFNFKFPFQGQKIQFQDDPESTYEKTMIILWYIPINWYLYYIFQLPLMEPVITPSVRRPALSKIPQPTSVNMTPTDVDL